MKHFSQKELQLLKTETEQILQNMEEGLTTRDILTRLYTERLEDKSTEQGQLMADFILRNIRKFDESYKEAQTDPDSFIQKFQDSADEGKSCAERCSYWLQFTAAVSAASAASEETDREAVAGELDSLSISPEEATEAKAAELRAKAAEALKNSGVMLDGLTAQADALAEAADAGEAAKLLLDFGAKKVEYRAILSMLTYIGVKNGLFPDVPSDMTAQEITALVCAEVEQTRIMGEVGKGRMAVDVATFLLTALGIVVLAIVSLHVILLGCALASTLFGFILTIPACLIVVAGVLCLFPKLADFWEETSEKLVGAAVKAVSAIISGLKAVAAYIREHLLPKVVEVADRIFASVKDMTADPVQAENETVPENA